MKYLVFILVFLNLNLCAQREMSNQVLGAWELIPNDPQSGHLEMYIDKDNVYIFIEGTYGLAIVQRVEINNDSLLLYVSDDKPPANFKIVLNNNNLSLKSESSEISYKKITDTDIHEKFVKGKIDENTFNNEFLKRLQ